MIRPPLRFGVAVLAVGVAALALVPGCGPKTVVDGWPEQPGPKVLVSFAPYYCFAANVAGSDAAVRSLMTTSGPHHFQPTDRDAFLVQRASIFFINGLGLEGETPEKLKTGSGNSGLKIVDLSARIPKDQLCDARDDDDDDDDRDKDHHDQDHHHHHDKGGKDPHVWLSPDEAIYLVEGIRDELKAVDPPHAADYDRRAAEYIGKLKKLKEDGVAMLKDKKDRKMVTFHESLTYFAKSFNVEIVDVVEKTPGAEPSGKQLEKIIELCTKKDKPVRLITVEPQYSNSNAGTELVKVLKRKGVADPVLVEFDTLETVVPEQLTPDWYEVKMRENLKALAEKMK